MRMYGLTISSLLKMMEITNADDMGTYKEETACQSSVHVCKQGRLHVPLRWESIEIVWTSNQRSFLALAKDAYTQLNDGIFVGYR